MAPRPSCASITHRPSRAPIMVPPARLGSSPAHEKEFVIISIADPGRRRLQWPLAHPGLPPMSSAAPPTAVLLVAHGSRRAEANADLDHLAAALRARGRYAHVATAYLELAEPDVAAGGAACAAGGAARVILVPYFLSAGVHVREDLEAARRALAARFPGTEFRLAEPLGRHPLLVEVVADRAGEAADGW